MIKHVSSNVITIVYIVYIQDYMDSIAGLSLNEQAYNSTRKIHSYVTHTHLSFPSFALSHFSYHLGPTNKSIFSGCNNA